MRTLFRLTPVIVLALAAAACSPATGMPVANVPPAASVAYPEIAFGATDGDVFEYH